ncbi:NfeD family protein [Adhaeribacter swui]|uniref:NfeD family protein n=1 Tax=Adhaeribacter swui TaxID=2086471 RepID=A0A7G7G5M4_9BACT|nr:NfeD family protein [Adhaeribacter swui]QNF32458.1 NfeD family protein [Adhaeribacter swui]
MDLITVLILVFIGLVLLLVELIFLPGITLIGILGFLVLAVGVWLGYDKMGMANGHIILSIALVLSIAIVFFSFKADVWSKFALKDVNHSRVNDNVKPQLQEGDTGKALSALRPSGTAMFHDQPYEVHTNGEFLDPDTTIIITRINHYKVIVKPVS